MKSVPEQAATSPLQGQRGKSGPSPRGTDERAEGPERVELFFARLKETQGSVQRARGYDPATIQALAAALDSGTLSLAALEQTLSECGVTRPNRLLARVEKRRANGWERVATDYGNAERLVARHGRDLMYVHARKSWLIWDGRRWTTDQTGEVERCAKETVRSIALEVATLYESAGRTKDSAYRAELSEAAEALAKWARQSEKADRLRAVVSVAQSESDIAVVPQNLDTNPWLLNCQNGTLNLRTATLSPHRREDRITKLAPVDYDADARCPAWLAFLDRVTNGDDQLVTYIQRCAGYGLTGCTSEQVLILLYGAGANGKSTFLEMIRSVLGDYAKQTDFSTFLSRDRDGPRNDIARLDGTRFVTAVEAEGAGRRLDEVVVKQMTGGDTVAARFLYQEFFEFRPTHKVFLAANHRPQVLGTDHAIWRRIRVIPFDVTIPDAERDKKLPERLSQELPGILAWAVRGCMAWQKEGLREAESVRRATERYKDDMDPLGGFLETCCVVNPLARATAKDLYFAYVNWSEGAGEEVISSKAFGMRLAERGFKQQRSGSARFWTGVALKEKGAKRASWGTARR